MGMVTAVMVKTVKMKKTSICCTYCIIYNRMQCALERSMSLKLVISLNARNLYRSLVDNLTLKVYFFVAGEIISMALLYL